MMKTIIKYLTAGVLVALLIGLLILISWTLVPLYTGSITESTLYGFEWIVVILGSTAISSSLLILPIKFIYLLFSSGITPLQRRLKIAIQDVWRSRSLWILSGMLLCVGMLFMLLCRTIGFNSVGYIMAMGIMIFIAIIQIKIRR